MAITFTHVIPPNNRSIPRFISRPDRIEKMAAAINRAGGKFEVRETPEREAIITCIHLSKVIARKITPIVGNIIRNAVDEVVEKAFRILEEDNSTHA